MDLLALDRQVCFALAAASRSVIGLYRPILEPLGLTHPQYLVMLALWEESPLRARDVADKLYLEPATLSPILKRLDEAGLIVRTRSDDDARAVDIELTDAGRALRTQAEAVPREVIRRLGYSVDRLERLRDDLTALLAAANPPDAMLAPSPSTPGLG